MTRAISIDATPDQVWPWIAQLGRGAGWYSVDWLDNGRKTSAWHLVSWIPEPQLGDAAGIGYLREIDSGRSLTWWLGEASFVGSKVRMVTCFELLGDVGRTRVVSRISADGAGVFGPLALLLFRAIDSIMAARQLIGLRARVEAHDKSDDAPRDPETGDHAQYQLYEVLYAASGSAGVAGEEHASDARAAAFADGVLDPSGESA